MSDEHVEDEDLALTISVGITVNEDTLRPVPVLSILAPDSGVTINVPLGNNLGALSSQLFGVSMVVDEVDREVEARGCADVEDVMQVIMEAQARHRSGGI